MSSIASKNKYLKIESYELGTLTNVVYDVDGSFEDWSYAASWEQGEVLAKCNNITP